jgi:hypothetical protein
MKSATGGNMTGDTNKLAERYLGAAKTLRDLADYDRAGNPGSIVAEQHMQGAVALMELAIDQLALACTCQESDEVCRACIRAQEIDLKIKEVKGVRK